MYLRYVAYLIPSIAMVILNFPLAPFIVLFAEGKYPNAVLPKWLDWFQTPDNPLDGDRNWTLRVWQWRYKLPKPLQIYVGRVGWIWRNSAYNFDINVLGFHLKAPIAYKAWGNERVSDKPYTPGWVLRKAVNADGKKAFQFYAILPTFPSKCFRIMFGWKIWKQPKEKNFNKNIQLCITANPIKSRR